MNERVTFSKKEMMGGLIAIAVIIAVSILAMPILKPASAAGGGSDSTPPATQCVAPAVTSATDTVKAVETPVNSSTSTSTDTKTTTTNTTTKVVHDGSLVNVSDLVKVHDVTVGNILSDNLKNDTVNLPVNVNANNILNPVTNLLGGLDIL